MGQQASQEIPHQAEVETAKCPFAAAGFTTNTHEALVDIPCAYATMENSSKDWGKVSTSISLENYSTYLGSLHRNAYASYIRLMELEKTWGLWHLRSSTPMPFDPQPQVMAPASMEITKVSPELYRLAPAMSAIEISMRLVLDFLDVNLQSIDNPTVQQCREHRSYVQHHTRMDALVRNITAQMQMMRLILDLDGAETNENTAKSVYLLTSECSKETLGKKGAWWWKHSHSVLSPTSIAARLSAQVQAQFADLPFGLGVFNSEHSLHLPFDTVVAPSFLREFACENEERFAEDHFFSTVHQICEAWCCVMERQLDAAQVDIDSLPTINDDTVPKLMQRIARRYRFCAQIWEYLIDHSTMLTEMDMRDYHTLRLHLHGASGGQSIRMRQLKRRISHLLPLVPQKFIAYVTASYDATTFTPNSWMEVLQLLAHVRSSDHEESNENLITHLQQLFAHHEAPACYVMGVIQAIQTLENNVRRFYFGHQYMAIMVLGGGATGTEDFTMKMLERTWKDPKRYWGCEQAKTKLSNALDSNQLQNEPDAKGKLIQKLLAISKQRHAQAKTPSTTSIAPAA